MLPILRSCASSREGCGRCCDGFKVMMMGAGVVLCGGGWWVMGASGRGRGGWLVEGGRWKVGRWVGGRW